MIMKKKDNDNIENQMIQESEEENNIETKQQTDIPKETKKKNHPRFWGVIIVIILIVIAAIVLMSKMGNGSKSNTTITTVTTVKEILTDSTLYTARYPYAGIAVKKDGEDIMYYVRYQGSVKAGFNIEEIQDPTVDEENGIITVILPEIVLSDPNVDTDADTFDCIFTKSSYETETVITEARKVAQKDLLKNARKDEKFLETAKENAINAIKASIEPLVNQVGDKQYTVEVIEQEAN